MILAGFGVRGVIVANSAAIAIAYLTIPPRLAARVPNPLHVSYVFREMMQALNFFSGQLLINNCGIVLVNHFFPVARGRYLCGRGDGGPRDLHLFAGGREFHVSAGCRDAGRGKKRPLGDRHFAGDGAGYGCGNRSVSLHRSGGDLDAACLEPDSRLPANTISRI